MKKLLALLLTGVLALSCVGCGATETTISEEEVALSENGLVPMKIAFCTWAGYAPLYIAVENGYFE